MVGILKWPTLFLLMIFKSELKAETAESLSSTADQPDVKSAESIEITTRSLTHLTTFTLHRNHKLNWKSAKNQCKKHGGQLATVSSDNKHLLAALLKLGKKEESWIGAKAKETKLEELKEITQTDTFGNDQSIFWCGRLSLKYNRAKRSAPGFERTKLGKPTFIEPTTTLLPTHDDSDENDELGFLHHSKNKKTMIYRYYVGGKTQSKCSAKYHFICQHKGIGINNTGTKLAKEKIVEYCENVKRKNKNRKGKCYTLDIEARPWSAAHSACKILGGTLTSVKDVYNAKGDIKSSFKKVIEKFTAEISQHGVTSLWLQESSHVWSWTTGESILSWDMFAKEPHPHGHCGMLRQRDKNFSLEWINNNCSNLYAFICQQNTDPSKVSDATTTVASTPAVVADCFRTIGVFPAVQKFEDFLIVVPYVLLGLLIGVLTLAIPTTHLKCKLWRVEKHLRRANNENSLYSMNDIRPGREMASYSSSMDPSRREYATAGDWLPKQVVYIPPPPSEKPPLPIPCDCAECGYNCQNYRCNQRPRPAHHPPQPQPHHLQHPAHHPAHHSQHHLHPPPPQYTAAVHHITVEEPQGIENEAFDPPEHNFNVEPHHHNQAPVEVRVRSRSCDDYDQGAAAGGAGGLGPGVRVKKDSKGNIYGKKRKKSKKSLSKNSNCVGGEDDDDDCFPPPGNGGGVKHGWRKGKNKGQVSFEPVYNAYTRSSAIPTIVTD